MQIWTLTDSILTFNRNISTIQVSVLCTLYKPTIYRKMMLSESLHILLKWKKCLVISSVMDKVTSSEWHWLLNGLNLEWAESSSTHFNTSIWACAYSPFSVFWLRRRMRQLLGLGSGHNGCKDCVLSFFCTNCVMCALAREINLDMFVEKIQKE